MCTVSRLASLRSIDIGFGFIERDNADDIFVHYSEINDTGYRSLYERQCVEFIVVDGQKGPQAQIIVMA